MLRQLTVRDFALVREIDLAFEPGLTVLTGESGAGKTILLEALGLVLGDRANTASIRPGATRSEVTAEFNVGDNASARRFLHEQGLEEGGEATCLLRRVIGADGRSRAFVNGTPVNVSDLATLGATLIDIHAQNEHQQLLRRSVQLELLDEFAGATALAGDVAAAFRAWHGAVETLTSLRARIDAGRDRRDLLRYQVAELEELSLAPGEYEALDAQFRRLAKSQEITRTVAAAAAALSGESESSIDDLGRLLRSLDDIDDDHPRLEAARDLLRTALGHIDEVASELRHYDDALRDDPQELARIESRLERILDLARKHRLRPEHLADQMRSLAQELSGLDVDDSALDALSSAAKAHEARYRDLAKKLSARRRKAAKALEGAVGVHMRELGIKGGALAIEFTNAETERGIDVVEYRVRTNPKFPPGALSQIASGGERSRISLAIQVVLAESAHLPVLILDEADVGIGGTTADVVGRLLQNLARTTQVLCVTHAPQVAARGGHHLRVGKSADGETFIEPLSGEARIGELARMLGGREITPKTLEYAEELINAGAV